MFILSTDSRIQATESKKKRCIVLLKNVTMPNKAFILPTDLQPTTVLGNGV